MSSDPNRREVIDATYNTRGIGDVKVKINHLSGSDGGVVEIEFDEGILCRFESKSDRTMRLLLNGMEAQDVGKALAMIADYIQRNRFTK